MKRRRRCHQLALTWIVLLLQVSCGAKTGLRRPCIVELPRSAPTVVFVTDRTSALGGYLGDDPATRMQWDVVQRDLVAGLVTTITEVARVGWVSNPQAAFAGVECGAAVPVQIHPRLGGGEEMVSRLVRTYRDYPYGGAGTVAQALISAYRAMDEVSDERKKIVILFYSGTACEPSVEARTTLSEIAPVMTRTMVVYLTPLDASLGGGIQALATSISLAGGLASRHTHPAYYRINELAAMQATLVREVVVPYYCEFGVPEEISEGGRWSLLTFAGRTVPEGEVAGNGWAFAEDRRRVRLVGALCEEAMRERTPMRLVSTENLCQ